MLGMISCKKATELTEKQQIDGLTKAERLRLKFHLIICKGCKEYYRQSQKIESFLNSIDKQHPYPAMNRELKNRIKQRLNEQTTG